MQRPSQGQARHFDETRDTLSIKTEDIEDFYKKNLGKDGFVMLYILKAAAGDLVFIELLNEFWNDYHRKKR